VSIDHLWLEEAIEDGQRIRQHKVTLADDSVVAEGFTIGSQRVHVFPTITTDKLVIDVGDPEARLSAVSGFLTGIEQVPALEDQPVFATHKMH
jgi:hypothetical protein